MIIATLDKLDQHLGNPDTLLEQIILTKQKEVAGLKQQRVTGGFPIRTADECGPFRRCFEDSLRDRQKIPVIAEIKFKSPSAGTIVEPDLLDAALIGLRYQAANVACISVLTDKEYFGGSLVDLKSVREVTTIPILRKDFIIDEVQILESKESGASAVLLIVAVLGDRTGYMVNLCNLIGIECIVEVHTEQELEIALNSNCTIIGVNCRNLQTFATDLSVAERIVKRIPSKVLRICESGIKSPNDANNMLKQGFDALLMGECLMRSLNVQQFVDAIQRPRST